MSSKFAQWEHNPHHLQVSNEVEHQRIARVQEQAGKLQEELHITALVNSQCKGCLKSYNLCIVLLGGTDSILEGGKEDLAIPT